MKNVPLIKICNVKSEQDLTVVQAGGADVVGVRVLGRNFNPNKEFGFSALDAKKKAKLALKANQMDLLTSLVITPLDYVALSEAFKRVKLDFLQLHMNIDEEDVDLVQIREAFGNPKLIGLVSYEQVGRGGQLRLSSGTDLTVLDWARGGTGRFLSAATLERYAQAGHADKLMVAGGLDHMNVSDLLSILQPFALDLDSSVRDENRNISERRVARFVNSVERATKVEPGPTGLPYARANRLPWNRILDETIEDHELVARSKALSIVESNDRYTGSDAALNERIWKSLEQLRGFDEVKPEWLEAALIAFSSVTYFPTEMLRSSLRYLHLLVHKHLATLEVEFPDDPERHLNDFHLFTNDPGGLTEDYFRINRIHGRLDPAKHARVPGVQTLGDRLIDILDCNAIKSSSAAAEIKQISEKRTWVLLADQSLSGHSLNGDLERLLKFREIVNHADATKMPQLMVLCQVLTNTAENNLKINPTISEALKDNSLSIDAAIYLDDTFKVQSENCRYFQNDGQQNSFQDLCKWFAKKFISDDEDFDRMREKSGDNLEFGYRRAGLLIARQENCPTDSIPLLWYETSDPECDKKYRGPFPRVHSRIGDQKVENTQDLWSYALDHPDLLSKIKNAIGEDEAR